MKYMWQESGYLCLSIHAHIYIQREDKCGKVITVEFKWRVCGCSPFFEIFCRFEIFQNKKVKKSYNQNDVCYIKIIDLLVPLLCYTDFVI